MHRRPSLLLLVLIVLTAPALGAAAGEPGSELVVEGGWARPGGQLGEPFDSPIAPLGFGVKDGLELGFRWRWSLSPHLSLSPGFHVVDYRDFRGTDAVGDFRVTTTSLRYTLELLYMRGRPGAGFRPFLGVGAGVYRNRVAAVEKTDIEAFTESVNTLGLSVRGGLRVGRFELSAIWHRNRFDTWRWFNGDPVGAPSSYDWSNVGVRVGWSVPWPTPAKAKENLTTRGSRGANR